MKFRDILKTKYSLGKILGLLVIYLALFMLIGDYDKYEKGIYAVLFLFVIDGFYDYLATTKFAEYLFKGVGYLLYPFFWVGIIIFLFLNKQNIKENLSFYTDIYFEKGGKDV